MTIEGLLLQLLTGLSRAAILFLVAAGLSLVFGALRIVNIAHGSFYMVGAFLAVTVAEAVAGSPGFLVAVLAAPLAVAAISTVVEVGVLRRLYGKEHLLQLLATFAFLLIFADAVRFLWGERPSSVRQPEFARGAVNMLGTVFPKYSLFLIVVAVVLAGSLYLLMNHTGLGRDIRAAVSDPEMLGMVGVNVPRLFSAVFALGAALAGLGGVLAAPQSTVLLGMDVDIIVESFAVVIIGGLGSLLGTAVGAVLVGVTFAFGILWVPEAALAIVFVVMAAVLVWRPSGLFGVPER
ncbi:MAG: branched-chain amino acid ABC transporter permease [Acidimicrobiia bacterium]